MTTTIANPAPARHRETTAVLGMTLFLASWAMLLAALLFAYGLVRLRAPAWPPDDLPHLPLLLPLLGTIFLGQASLAVQRARRHPDRAAAPLAFSWLASAGFFAVQVLVWTGLWQQGLRLDVGPYGSVFFGLTGFHALHVLVGLGGLAALIVTALRGKLQAIPLRLWTLYVHMVSIFWLLVFVSVYLL
jgi:cytochrome c oxidase subunit 3